MILLIFNVLFYLAIICISTTNRSANLLPQSVDKQILTVDYASVGDTQKPVLLPSYFDVHGELRLRMSLTYQFTEYTAPSFIMQANHSFMTILLDGQEIYRVEPRNHSLGNYFVNIPLPPQLNGAVLEIRITIPDGGIKRIEFPTPIVANESVYLRQQLLYDVPSLLLSTQIFFCGLFVIGLSIAGRKHVALYHMLLQGLLALCCAVYFLCETFSVVYLAPSARIIYLIDMLSFALLTPLFLGLLVWESSGWRKQLIQTMIVLSLLNVAGQAILGLSGLVELRRMLPITHLTQVASILVIMPCLTYWVVKRKKTKNLWSYGLIILGGILDLTLFYFEQRYSNMFFARIAILVYFVQQIYVFVHLLIKQSTDKARENYYKMLALQDSLTGCFSRAAFERDRMALDHTVVHTVFSLDLNNLKQTNDLYGHSMGDQLIHAMGEMLRQLFLPSGKCYRVGGDEFWIICDDLAPGQAQEIVCALQQATTAYNAKQELPIGLSYAIGLCNTDETDGDLNLAIKLADIRMYEHKHQLKNIKG